MSVFLARARRARELEDRWPFAAPLLRFLVPVFELQDRIAADPGAWRELPLYVQRAGPPPLADRAGYWLDLPGPSGDEGADAFFALVHRQCIPGPSRQDGPCPRCGGPPLASLLRDDPEARALRRELVCGWCCQSWPHPRVCCPSCGEERAEKLPRLVPADTPELAVEGCRSCGRYLKVLDLSRDPKMEPVVDEVASLPLDVLAREQGWQRFAPNLAGV
jgi:formate dehydrogenase maturation protein FdhE